MYNDHFHVYFVNENIRLLYIAKNTSNQIVIQIDLLKTLNLYYASPER